jgi:hypothetical protein
MKTKSKTIGLSRTLKKAIVEKKKREVDEAEKNYQFGKKFQKLFPTACDEILKILGPGGGVGFYANGICISSPKIKRWAGSAFVTHIPIFFHDKYKDGKPVTFEEFTNKDVSEMIASELAEHLPELLP